VPKICFFSPLLHRFATFLALSWSWTVQKCLCGTDFDLEGVEILAKMMQNDKKKQMFGTPG